MSTFALTIWLYSITFIFLYVPLQMMKKMMKNHSKRAATKSVKISLYNYMQIILETAKISLKINWKQIEIETG